MIYLFGVALFLALGVSEYWRYFKNVEPMDDWQRGYDRVARRMVPLWFFAAFVALIAAVIDGLVR